MTLITKTYAGRLNRFKKADHWTQRRIEEGFVVAAKCIAENRRAVDRLWSKNTHLDNISIFIRDTEIIPPEFSEFKCDFRPAWTKFKSAIMKDFETVCLGCLDALAMAIDEVKDAFPFWWYCRNPFLPSGHFKQTNVLIKWADLCGVKRIPFEPNWHLRARTTNVLILPEHKQSCKAPFWLLMAFFFGSVALGLLFRHFNIVW